MPRDENRKPEEPEIDQDLVVQDKKDIDPDLITQLKGGEKLDKDLVTRLKENRETGESS